ncbi:MAG: UDP-N-acetylmuramate dehydrogenase [Chloroflexi bacterium]|nr:UDP-N-acetylmuramate dehydrogenase [Chloroflexota bacterium]
MKEPEGLLRNEPMSRHTTLHVGGAADFFISCINEDGLLEAVEWAKAKNKPLLIIGAGSNLLVSDDGIEGVVIKLDGEFKVLKQVSPTLISAGCSVFVPELSRYCAEKGLGGLEFARGIPGSLGGALVMNAGAYGHSIGELIRSVRLFRDGNFFTINKKEINFGYRESGFLHESILLFAEIELVPGSAEKLEETAAEFMRKRKERQPLNAWSAGCAFRNPPGEKAWKLIEESGAHLFKVGGAEVSGLHKNFIINTGKAHASDIWRLMCMVKDKVKSETGIELEMEVKKVGRW